MNQPDNSRRAFRHEAGEPVFSEHWHAQVVAVLDVLLEQGSADPGEWSARLSAELEAPKADDADDDAHYYAAFLRALEALLTDLGMAHTAQIDKRTEDWRTAYVTTPHGKPINLGS